MSSFEEKLGTKAKESNYISLSELGNEIKGTITGEPQFKSDKRGNEAVYITIETKAGMVVQKFGKSLYEHLLTQIKQCGGLQNLQKTEHKWVAQKKGRAQFNRFFPVPNKEDKAIA